VREAGRRLRTGWYLRESASPASPSLTAPSVGSKGSTLSDHRGERLETPERSATLLVKPWTNAR
jgi:hypothetical protein